MVATCRKAKENAAVLAKPAPADTWEIALPAVVGEGQVGHAPSDHAGRQGQERRRVGRFGNAVGAHSRAAEGCQ